MEKARRAEQLVAQVNLKRIVEHDASEFEKLTKVNQAMDSLCKEGAYDDSIRPLGFIPHNQGLPEFDVCVAPEHSPPDGAQGIFISEQGIFAAFIPEPATRYKWRILRSRPYDDHAELLTTVRRFAAPPTE